MSAFFAPEHFVSDFLNMGGYGSFIWPSYLLTTLILGVLSWIIILRNIRAKRRLNNAEQKAAAV